MPARRIAGNTEHAIRERAYYMWEQDGRPHGRDIEYWDRAAAEAAAKPKRAKIAAAKMTTAKTVVASQWQKEPPRREPAAARE